MSIKLNFFIREGHTQAELAYNGQVEIVMADNVKIDRRIERTRQALLQALQALLQHKSWDVINVRMICDQANIARSSFYLHFQNKQELMDFAFSDLTDRLSSDIVFANQSQPHFVSLLWLVDHISEMSDFFIRSQTSQHAIRSRFQSTFKALFEKELHHKNLPATNVQLTFITGGIFAAISDGIHCHQKINDQSFVAEIESQILQILKIDDA